MQRLGDVAVARVPCVIDRQVHRRARPGSRDLTSIHGGAHKCAIEPIGQQASDRRHQRLGPARWASHRKSRASIGSTAGAGWWPRHQDHEGQSSRTRWRPPRRLNRATSSGVRSSSRSSLWQRALAPANASLVASSSRNLPAMAIAVSRVSAAPVTKAISFVAPGSRVMRRRKLKIGSSTGPVVRDKQFPESRAAGLAGVRPRPRNLVRSVSYWLSWAETLAVEV